jgi:hypothetical protein
MQLRGWNPSCGDQEDWTFGYLTGRMTRRSGLFMATNFDFGPMLLGGLGIYGGLYCFFKGFKIFRDSRLISDTPEGAIRGLAMGLVNVRGKAKLAGEKKLIDSPVSHTPCLYYKVEVARYERERKNQHAFNHYRTDFSDQPFYLDDGTGQVLVNPKEAELDLPCNAKRITEHFGDIRSRLTKAHSGKAATPPSASSSEEAESDELTFYAITRKSVPGMRFSLEKSWLSLGGLALDDEPDYRCFQLTEFCILPDHLYDITGTCTARPGHKSESDRNIIMKGEKEPTFVISWRDEKGVERLIRVRAFKYVLGGSALTLVSVAWLVFSFGWF